MMAFRAAFVLAAACAWGLTDGTGHPVVSTPAVRVVSLTVMTDEFLAELLPPDRILAYSRSVDDPRISNAVEAAKSVKGRVWLDLETLIALKPDLILAADWSDGADLDFLRGKGFAVYAVKTPRRWSEVKDAISALGTVLSRSEAAQSLLGRLDADERALGGVRARVIHPVSVLEFDGTSSMARGTLWDEMVALAGLSNASAGLGTDRYGFAPLSNEMLFKLDPDWLVLSEPEAASLQSDPLYHGLKAVRQGHLLVFSDAITTSTSHAALHAALMLQHAAYPNLR
jgi:iron complex transport system substrate-binding protein